MVYRVYVEKKEGLRNEAQALKNDIRDFLGIPGIEELRLFNRYDAENITPELFGYAIKTVFSEPQTDDVFVADPELGTGHIFAVEFLPGQFDQRADSAEQCIQLISQGDRPLIRSAKVYALYGELSDADIEKIKKHVINPVEAREASLDLPETLKMDFDVPKTVRTLAGFNSLDREGLSAFIDEFGLAMDPDDIAFCQAYFKGEDREPTITEIRMLDTYWSDHCRHTTFLTNIDTVKFGDPLIERTYNEYLATRESLGRTSPVCLMDIATVAAKSLKKQGLLDKLDESEEINACTVKIDVTVDGKTEPWLLLFKNETHNHPTEIEPFGGAATCIGGAIRDPLSGRAYVYGAMRLTGAADPTAPLDKTIPGKLPQRKIVTTAAAGYSSYGNQIGLATGIVDEIYHPGYAAKHMEIGAVIAAAPQANVRRERPAPGDVVILLGGDTGRDGIGGATGSSKAHNLKSVETCSAEVQKGNAPVERKLQRLFSKGEVSRLIKRCNDFGAGGVSVAVGELADGLDIDLDAVPKKYEGLDGTELAISESQERMAVVVAAEDADRFIEEAKKENLNAVPVAEVTDTNRLVMKWQGNTIVDISREFLNSNGAPKHIGIETAAPAPFDAEPVRSFSEGLPKLAGDLNICSKRGLSECFDSTIGAGSVLMPFGGKNQLTPVQAMVQKISSEHGDTDDVSLMAWGYNPYLSERSPYHGAYLAVVESVSKLIATGSDFKDVYLTFQEYFEKPLKDPKRWGKPLAALLGSFKAQLDLKIASIGGKDSMSGSFEDIDVPPTLVSFAVSTDKADNIVSPEFKNAGGKVYLIAPDYDENGLPVTDSILKVFAAVTELQRNKKAVSVWTPGAGGIAEGILKCCFGNGFGFLFDPDVPTDRLFALNYGAFLVEASDGADIDGEFIGTITEEKCFVYGNESVPSGDILCAYEDKLEAVYPCNIDQSNVAPENITFDNKNPKPYSTPHSSLLTPHSKPKVLIPVFPGTNCEYDTAKAFENAGAQAETFVIANLNADMIRRSADEFAKKLKEAHILFIPGGFSGSDEPDGSGKFITAFFRNEQIRNATMELLDNTGGLVGGICNGFQALIKLGLVPYGKIIDVDEHSPTLTFNTVSRHRSKIVRTRIASNKSPWLSLMKPGDIVNVPISHGEGRFICEPELFRTLAENGQIATQYVDLDGNATNDIHFNPNNSYFAVEGITSPDGRVFGKMGHSERTGKNLYKNIPGSFDIRMFEAAVKFFG